MKTKFEKIRLYPVIFAWGLIPLIVRMKQYNTGYSQYDWFGNAADQQVDFFLVYKSYFIIATAVVMAALLAYTFLSARKKQFKFEAAFYCLAAYAFLALGSFAFSEYKYYVSHGAYELFESVWVVLAYLVICYYAYNVANSGDDVYYIIKWSCIGFGVLGAIGLSQALYMDFFKTPVGKRLITPSSYWGNLDSISFSFDEGTVYATLYNPDWVGFYVGIVLPVVLVMCYWTKKLWAKVVYGILAVVMLICLLRAQALGGIIGVLAAVIIGIYVLLSRSKKGIVAACGLTVAGFIGLAVFLLNTATGQSIVQTFVGTAKGHENFPIKEIRTTDGDVVFNVNGNNLHISYNVDGDYVSVNCCDDIGTLIETTKSADGLTTIVADAEKYANCQITPVYIEDDICIDVNIDGRDWYFTNQLDGTYYFYNPLGKFVKMQQLADVGIFNNDGFQNRGVIWNHVIPLLKNYIIFGSGANTFAQVYPQDDYIYKEYMGMKYMYDVKAHNWYLQQWLEEGLLALLAMLAFYAIYFVQSIKLYRKTSLKDPLVCIGFALFTGINCYMILAIVNDSNVNTAPVLWVAYGLGYAVNRMIRTRE